MCQNDTNFGMPRFAKPMQQTTYYKVVLLHKNDAKTKTQIFYAGYLLNWITVAYD